MTEVAAEVIVDVAFRLPGGQLPVDHAYALCEEIAEVLPWFAGEAAARLHLVHTAESGSGWMRPQPDSHGKLHLSRRTKLKLRVPQRRAADTMALSGRRLNIGGHPLVPGSAKILPLVPAGTLLARHVVCDRNEDESGLNARFTRDLGESGVDGATLIFGRAHRITTPESVLHTRSLVVTNLNRDGALHLLRNGIGSDGKLGCGIFIPYKRID